ncbi:MAG: hypothetical protein Q8927_16645 [Bacteroidota bacterium]|nr:hypothetical protein [Bacteroidota bacterium]
MRVLYTLLIAVLLNGIADAQSPKSPYWIISTGVRSIFLPDPGFPPWFDYSYTSNGQYGSFVGTISRPLPTRIYSYDLPAIEAVFRHGAIDFGIGLQNNLGNDRNFYMKLGYKYILHVNDIRIEPGFDLYDLIGKNEPMGSIDNRGAEIDILGFQAMPTWSKTSTDDDGNTTTTDIHYADHLDVDFNRSALMFNPKLTLSANPIGRIFFRIEAGYSLQIEQTSKVNFIQRDAKGHGNKIGDNHLDDVGSFNGPVAGVSIGYALGARATPRRAIHLFKP